MPPVRDELVHSPSAQELLRLAVHVVTRDWPETLAVFRRHGVQLPEAGGHAVARVAGDADALAAELARATAWRAELTGS